MPGTSTILRTVPGDRQLPSGIEDGAHHRWELSIALPATQPMLAHRDQAGNLIDEVQIPLPANFTRCSGAYLIVRNANTLVVKGWAHGPAGDPRPNAEWEYVVGPFVPIGQSGGTPPPAPPPTPAPAVDVQAIADAVRSRLLADLQSDTVRHGIGGLALDSDKTALTELKVLTTSNLQSAIVGQLDQYLRDRFFEACTEALRKAGFPPKA